MATLRAQLVLGLACLGAVLIGGSASGDDITARLAPFIKAPPSIGYWVWWRPERIIPEPQIMGRLMEKLESTELPQNQRRTPEAIFGGIDANSALLFPVLAAGGEKGTKILAEYLRLYDAQHRDDRWLLVIAALGRNRSELALQELNAEMRRVKAYLRANPPQVIDDVEIPELCIRLPVADARLAWYAGVNKLTWDIVEEQVSAVDADASFVLRVAALEWGRLLMNERAFRTLVADGIARIADADIAAFLEKRSYPDNSPLRSFRIFLPAKENWPLVEELVQADGMRPLAKAFLIMMLFSTRISMATYNDGLYELSAPLAEKVIKADLVTYRSLAQSAAILHHCQMKEENPAWQAFLDRHASKLDTADAEFVAYVLNGRIHAPKTPTLRMQLFEGDPPYAHETRPGVYFKGFGYRGL